MKKKDDQLTFHINYVNRVYPIIIMVLCLMIIGGLYVVNSEVLEANSLISEFQRIDTMKDEAHEKCLEEAREKGGYCQLFSDGTAKCVKCDVLEKLNFAGVGDDDQNICDHIQTHCEDHTCTEDCTMEVP